MVPQTPKPLQVLDARAFPAMARYNGLPSATSLVVSGRLLPLTVGRRTYYRWADLLQAMPGWARRQNAELQWHAIELLGGAK